MLDFSFDSNILRTCFERSPQEQEQWELLFRTLFAEAELIARQVRIAMQIELPSYQGLPTGKLDPEVLIEVTGVLHNARLGATTAGTSPLSELSAVGARRGRQGIPVDEMLRAWTIGVQVVIRHARERAKALGIDTERILEFIQSTLAWSDAAMVTTTTAHRGVELELARKSHERQSAFTRDVLFGTVAPAEILSHASTYGLDARQQYVAVRARHHEGSADGQLDRVLPFRSSESGRSGASVLVDGDLAGFLREPPQGLTAAVIGVGPARTLDQLSESFRLATRALDTARDFGLVGIHDMTSLGLKVAVAADRDVGEAMYQRYVAPIASSSSGEELTASLREYLACGMHVERTAERLFVHQNTVRYRVSRCEEIIGVNFRDPGVAFELSWALDWTIVRTQS
ncbi:helix-turn-helix domain-containing protein [Rhodococcus erythropolis]|uniref:PucR family transcriptional regulator n=1 Tax=Rhodococcus erythropolis TaxID=1833 RepID=UPI001E5B261D|nr:MULTISPECIES: PucR family transcriptional regulator [Rhodococcus erythropolis group]MCD2107139.1 helix-turn-helix domain-containing protein [Rhodococcus qingshengii]MCZ4526568.1 helix-turn-helix domain-containing protein [Rhodococcus erythropolis]